MTPEEYYQLKAFARQDGARLSLLWIVGFACYVVGLKSPLLGMAALLFVIISPFYAASRLRSFRDNALDGVISFARGYAYTIHTFFYAGLLLAVVMFVYFNFMDNGYLLSQFTKMLYSTDGQQALQAYGLQDQMTEGLKELAAMRPIDYALNMLTVNILTGFLLGLPIALLTQRTAECNL